MERSIFFFSLIIFLCKVVCILVVLATSFLIYLLFCSILGRPPPLQALLHPYRTTTITRISQRMEEGKNSSFIME